MFCVVGSQFALLLVFPVTLIVSQLWWPRFLYLRATSPAEEAARRDLAIPHPDDLPPIGLSPELFRMGKSPAISEFEREV
jgi:hypothetical protein